jgi:paraquat-inducible protein B
MRATLASGSLVTGSKYISIDYFPDTEPAVPGEFEGYTTIPTVPGGFERIEQQLYALLEKFNQLPLETTVAGANDALADIGTTLESLRAVLDDEKLQELAGRLELTLAEVQTALAGFSPDSEIYRNLSASLADLDRMVQHLEAFSRTIATQPNAALFGADIPPDPVPEARPR